MGKFLKTSLCAALISISAAISLHSQNNAGYDVFIPISKYISQGDSEKLSAWFADNLEVCIRASSNTSSKSQARQIIKSFFNTYTPRSLTIIHTAGRDNMKYVLGDLYAGGETFRMTLFVVCKGESYEIQQIKIDRI